MAVQREESVPDYELEDSYAISLADTDESEQTSEYEVECVLDEKISDMIDEDGEPKPTTLYLIKWLGYSNSRATWEPFTKLRRADDTLKEWENLKRERENGSKPPFDRNLWEREVAEIEKKRLRRHRRRNKKRAQLGRPEVLYRTNEYRRDEYAAGNEAATAQAPASSTSVSVSRSNVPQRNELQASSTGQKEPERGDPRQGNPRRSERERSVQGRYTSDTAMEDADDIPTNTPVRKRAREFRATEVLNVFDPKLLEYQKAPTRRHRAPTARPSWFRSLQHANRVRKKLQEEPAPNINHLQLRDLTTGERVVLAQARPTRTDDTPMTGTSREATEQNRGSVVASTEITAPTSDATLTCWYWKHEVCEKRQCGLAHHETGFAEPHNQSKTLITCPHWLKGKCPARAGCKYAHQRTKYIFDLETLCVHRLDPDQTNRNVQKPLDARGSRPSNIDTSLANTLTTRPAGPAIKSYACYYWAKDGLECRRSADKCKYAHEFRDFVRRGDSSNMTYLMFPKLRALVSPTDQVATGSSRAPFAEQEPVCIFGFPYSEARVSLPRFNDETEAGSNGKTVPDLNPSEVAFRAPEARMYTPEAESSNNDTTVQQLSTSASSSTGQSEPGRINFNYTPLLSHIRRHGNSNISQLQTLQPPEFEPPFASGVACCFADSIITEKPVQSCSAIKKLDELITQNRNGAKILGRPNMMGWLHDVMMEEWDKIKKGTTSAGDNLDALMEISMVLRKILEQYPPSTSRHATFLQRLQPRLLHCASAPARDCPVYFLHSGLFGQFEAAMRDPRPDKERIQRHGDKLMLEWFSGWASAHANEFRRFYFFVQQPDDILEPLKERHGHIIISTMPEGNSGLGFDQVIGQ